MDPNKFAPITLSSGFKPTHISEDTDGDGCLSSEQLLKMHPETFRC